MHPGRTSTLSRIGRGLTPVLGAALGIVIMRRYADQWVSWFGFAIAVFSILRVALHPVLWWRFVLDGVAPTPPTDTQYTQPGRYRVELTSAGGRPIEVVKALREVSGLGMLEAKQRVDAAPTMIAGNLAESSAARVRDRITRAGGQATVHDG